MSGSSPIKTRAMMYEQQLSHLPASVDDMYGKIVALSPKRYAGIVHDCDQTDAGRPTAAHLHVMMEFANPRSVRSIAKALGDKPERIEAWKAGVENGFSYLCHKTDGARSKHQYDPGLVDLLLGDDRRIALHIRCGRINGREPHQQEREKRDDKQSQQNDGDSPNEIPPGPLCHKTTSK